MQRAGKIICWLSVVLIGLLFLKPLLLPFFHLQYNSPWLHREAVVRRYLQMAILFPFTLLGTLQNRRPGSKMLIIVATLTITGGFLYYATRDLDKEIPYHTHTVKELFQNNSDSSERIILQADDSGPDGTLSRPSVLMVKPYSREMQIVYAADTNHLEAGKWKRIY